MLVKDTPAAEQVEQFAEHLAAELRCRSSEALQKANQHVGCLPPVLVAYNSRADPAAASANYDLPPSRIAYPVQSKYLWRGRAFRSARSHPSPDRPDLYAGHVSNCVRWVAVHTDI
jgi:hypothetical protein